MKLCQIEGCKKPYYAKGLCEKHYYQLPKWRAYWETHYHEYYSKPEVKTRMKAYYQQPEAHSRKILAQSKYRSKQETKERIRLYRGIYRKKRSKVDLKYRLTERLRVSLYQALKLYSEGKKWKASKYGIDWKLSCKKLLETKPVDFSERKYHIDHIKPLCSFDLTDIEQIKQAFSTDNLQWLTAEENIRKGGRGDYV
jgi:hypothetical protein